MESSRNTSDSPLLHRYNTRLRKRQHSVNYNEDSDVSDNDFIESDNKSISSFKDNDLVKKHQALWQEIWSRHDEKESPQKALAYLMVRSMLETR